MSGPQYKISQQAFSPDHARVVAMSGVPGELYDDGAFLWWKPPVQESTRPLTAEAAQPYGRLPLHGHHLAARHRDQYDTAVVLGALDDTARKTMEENRTSVHCTFWAKECGSGDYLMVPKQAAHMLPALVPIVLTERANLPHPKLWPLLKYMVRVEAGEVPPHQNVRVLDRAKGVSKKAVGYSYHKHIEPIAKEGATLLLGEYLVSDKLPTIICDNHRELAQAETLNDDEMLVQKAGRGAKARAITRPATAMPGHVTMISGLSAHDTLVNTTDQPVFRNFMRVFCRVGARELERAMIDDPSIRDSLRASRPEMLQVSTRLKA